jgi:hypothetical protein
MQYAAGVNRALLLSIPEQHVGIAAFDEAG